MTARACLLVLLLTGLVGCAGSKPDDTSTDPDRKPAPGTGDTPVPLVYDPSTVPVESSPAGDDTISGETEPIDPAVSLSLVLAGPTFVPCSIIDDRKVLSCESLAHGDVSDSTMFLMLVMTRKGGFADGVGGVQFGFEYTDPTTRIPFRICTGGSEIPARGWPRSGSGDAMTWYMGCYEPQGEIALVGYFVLEDGIPDADAIFRITGDPRVEQALWVDCQGDRFAICPENLPVIDLHDPGTPFCGGSCSH